MQYAVAEPEQSYWRQLYPSYAAGDSVAFWLGKQKTLENCIALWEERERVRLAGEVPLTSAEHTTAVITARASPVRSVTARVCMNCTWVSRELDAAHVLA
jgi:hypothetical protein